MSLRPPDKTVALAQKLRFVASDQNGEVVSAVRMLAGALGRTGKSLHDLADPVQPGNEPAQPMQPTPSWYLPQPVWTPEQTRGEDAVDNEQEDLKRSIDAVSKQDQRLAWLRPLIKQKLETADKDASRVLVKKNDPGSFGGWSTGYLLKSPGTAAVHPTNQPGVVRGS